MKRSLIFFLTIVLVLGAFGLASRTKVSASSTMTLYAQLTSTAETPAAATADTPGNGLATITLNVVTDYYNTVTSATANFDVTLSGFPDGDQITNAHIHIGDPGVAGAVVVDTMVGMKSFTNGAATLHLASVDVTPSMAQQIMGNPAGFYFNVHTMMSPGGAVRGQLSTTKPTPQTTTSQMAFTAQLMPGNEVPAVTNADSTGSGRGNVVLHLTEDASNTILSATADFSFNVSNMPSSDQIVLAHVHQGAAGANGGVVISSGLSPSAPIAIANGSATFSTTGLTVDPATAQQIVSNPAGFYFNVHTSDSPNGAMRGQLQQATNTNVTLALDAVLSPANEVPPVTGPDATGKGQGSVILHLTEDPTGNVVSATADFAFSVSNLPTTDSVILAHLHQGAAGANGGVVISSGLSPATAISLPNGSADFSTTGIAVDNATAQGIMSNPAGFYFNVHTTDSPNGAMRGQLQVANKTVSLELGAVLSPANEVPSVTGSEASAKGQGNVVLHLTEDSAGNVASATADFSFTVSGLPANDPIILSHVHQGAKGMNGGVVISSGISPSSPITPANGSATFSTTGIPVSNDIAELMVSDPAGFYFNIHSMLSTGGVMRGQMEVLPTVTNASITGKKLFVTGTSFVKGDTILINGTAVATKFQSATQLLAKKAGKMIAAGQTVTIQVQQADGLVTTNFMFTRSQ